MHGQIKRSVTNHLTLYVGNVKIGQNKHLHNIFGQNVHLDEIRILGKMIVKQNELLIKKKPLTKWSPDEMNFGWNKHGQNKYEMKQNWPKWT